MSNVVDDRIVNMRFDNSNFEKNVATSMNTLDKLKKSLDFSNSEKSLQGLQNATNGFSTGKIEEALTALQNRFSTIGIVGMTVIQNLTNSALSMIGNISSRIYNLIASGGMARAMNIENAKFQLEGLGIKYKDVFDAIDYAVTNTAYGLDAAAQAASQLSAAGLDYKNVIMTHKTDNKELTQMSMALRAVSGVAAQTQSDYAMVARYFQDVANAGQVTGATLTYMTQVLNLPVKQDLAKGLQEIAKGGYEASEGVKKAVESMVKGTEVSMEDVENFASKGLLTFDIFSTIMFNKYADHAVAANRTITGVMSNIRAAFSKIGAEFVSPIIEIDGVVVQMLDSIRAKVNQIKPLIIPFAKSLTDSIKTLVSLIKSGIDSVNLDWMKPFFTGLGKVVEGLTQDFITIKYAFKSIFPDDTTNRLKKFAENFEKFGKSFADREKNISRIQQLSERFKGLFSLFSAAKTIIQALLSPFKGFIEAVKEGLQFSGRWADTFSGWAKSLDEALKNSEKLKEFSNKLFGIGKEIGSTVMTIPSYFIEAVNAIKNRGVTGLLDVLLGSDGFVTNLGESVISIVEILTGKDLSGAKDAFEHILGGIKDALSAFTNTVGGLKDKFGGFISTFIDNLKKFKIDLSPLGEFIQNLSGETKPIEGIFDFLGRVITGFFTLLTNVVPGIIGTLKTLVSPIVDFVKSIFKALKGDGSIDSSLENTTLAVVLYQLKNVYVQINKLFGKKHPLKGINDFISQLQDAAFQLEKNLNAQYWLKIAGSILLIAFAMKLIADIPKDRIAEAVGVILLLFKSLTQIGQTLSSEANTILDNKWMQKAVGNVFPSFIQLAAGVLILSFALSKVASVPADRLWESFVVIELLLVSMAGVGKLLASESNTILDNKWMQKATNNTFPSFIKMAAAVYILAMAVKKIAEVPADRLGEAVLVVEVLLMTMAVISEVLSMTSKGKTGGGIGGFTMIGMAASVYILAKAVQKIAEVPKEDLLRAMVAIEVLLVTMGVISKLLSTGSSMDSLKMISVGIGLIAIAASMKIFASAASDFAGLNWEDLGKAGAAMAAIVGMVIVLSKLTASTSGFGITPDGLFGGASQAKNMIELGAGLIAIAAAMKIFASAAEDFADLSWGELGKAGVAIGSLMVALGLFGHFVDGGNLAKASAAMMIFSVALLVMVPAIEAFAHLNIGQVAAALLMMAGILITLAVAAKATEGIQGAMLKLSATLLIFGVALAAVGGGLVALSAGVAAAAGSIVLIVDFIINLVKSVIIGVIEVVTESAAKIAEAVMVLVESVLLSLQDHLPVIVDTLLNIIIQVLNILTSRVPELASSIKSLVGALVDAFGISISEIDPEKFIMVMAGISAFLLAIGVAANIAKKALLGVVGIVAVMAAIVGMFALLKMIGYDADELLHISEGLSLIMVSLAATMAIISMVPVAMAAQGIAGFAIVIAGLTAILAALGGLKQIPGFEWLIDEGTVILAKIGTAIGEFVGSIISGFGIGLTSGLPEMADNLSNFAVRLMPFIMTMKMIDDKVLSSTLTLVGVIAALTAMDLVDSLTSWLTGGVDFSKFGAQLAAFGPYIMQFANSVAGINGDDVQAAANAGKALAEMASNIPNSGGLLGKLFGENDMDQFGAQLEKFGESIMRFATKVEGLKADVVENAARCGEVMVELADTIPNSGGLVSAFTGDNKMDEFGTQLEKFGESMMEFSNTVDGLKANVVDNAAKCGEVMVELANKIPNSSGIVSWFTGNNDMDDFGVQLVVFGKSMVEFSNTVSGVDTNLVKNTATVAGSLIELATKIPESSGIVSWFTGDNDFGDFGKSLRKFGESMAEFSESLIGVDLSMIPSVTEATRGLIALANEIANTQVDNVSTFGKNMKQFASNLAGFGKEYVTLFVNEFINAVDAVNSAITTFIGYIITALESNKNKLNTAGKDSADAYIRGIKSRKDAARGAAKELADEVLKGFSGLKDSFYTVGVNCIMGLVNGLYDEKSIGLLAARLSKIANVMMELIKGKLDEHSPSRKFMEIGEFAIEGLVIGVGNKTKDVENAMNGMGDTVVDNMQTVLDRVRESLDSEMDLNPVITPVVDLSNITDNAGYINGLFNRSVAVGNVRAASIVRPLSADEMNLQNAQINGVNGNTTFIQNNYSPKALNRMEIYRQTRNQFSQYREAMR